MPHSFPHTYKVTLSDIKASKATLHCENAPPLMGGAPPQFDGEDTHWSPETMLMGSIALCYLTTLHSLMKRHENLTIKKDDINIDGVLDKTREGLVFTEINLKVVCLSNDVAKATKILENAEKYCLISNAVKCPTTLHLTVNPL